MTALLLALLLAGKPVKAPAAPRGPGLDELRAALPRADPECREALKARLPPLEAALQSATTPEGRDKALDRLLDVMGSADATGCSDGVRLALSNLRLRLSAVAPASGAPPPAVGAVRADAIHHLRLAEEVATTKSCAAAAKPVFKKWVAHLESSKPLKGLVKEFRTRARALDKVCPEGVAERIEAAASALEDAT